MRRSIFIYALFDLVFLSLAYVIITLFKPAPSSYYSPLYIWGFAVMAVIWIFVSAVMKKYPVENGKKLHQVNLNILYSNFIILGAVIILMYGLRSLAYSRFIVFGTILAATLIEIAVGNIHYYIRKANSNGTAAVRKKKYAEHREALLQARQDLRIRETALSEENLRQEIIEECGWDSYDFILRHLDILNPRNLVISTTTRFNILYQPSDYLEGIVNLHRINDLRYINKFFEAVNSRLPAGGKYLSCAETSDLRKKRILKKYPPVLNGIIYFFDFIIKRVLPKFNATKGLYFFLTRGQNRAISRAEILGRLISSGFDITHEEVVNDKFFIVATKVSEPFYDGTPTYGPIIRLKRIGKEGKTIKVYKLRTMHAYSEYLQDYVYKMHNLHEGGKFNNDFRVSRIGKIMRIFWIDELPMVLNLFSGEIRLVGVRPLSEQYFSLYSKEHQERRIRYKPGLVPPYYADMPKSLEEIEASEKRFLDLYDEHPFSTNWKYFWRAMYNIIIRRARSK
jgi:hypothetical protein